MYCVKCGVELADSEKSCPLCGTEVILPRNVKRELTDPPYPPYPGAVTEGFSRSGVMSLITLLCLIPFTLCLIVDLKINGEIVWSGFASGAMLLGYILSLLPNWFRRPNPVIFVPAGFAAIGLYLLYINWAVDGNWFLSFAFPITGGLCLIVTAVVTLRRYIRRGALYIYGGASLALGGYMLLLEFLLHITFGLPGIGTWSPYPLTVFTLIGITLIVLAISPALRQSLERKFFI